jgi:hypothetical protein
MSISFIGLRRAAAALALLGAAAIPPSTAGAQVGNSPYLGSFTYTTAMPVGDTKDFANDFSWLGFTLEGDWFTRPNISTGFIAGWQEIYKNVKGDQFTFDNGAVYGSTYRHISSIPILLRARYWRGHQGEAFHPFAGLGLGTYWMKQTLDLGLYTAEESHWHFGLAPEVGVLMATKGGVGVTLNARYNYPFAAGDYLGGKSASFSYWGFGIGLAYGQ